MALNFEADEPVLIAGPTASGKSALGIRLAQKYNGVIINADALQVYSGWSVLSARPSLEETQQCPHWMYGHVSMDENYSTGEWLRDLQNHLKKARESNLRPIILGGTGLYFESLTKGIAEIPEISKEVKQAADEIEISNSKSHFAHLLLSQDPKTAERIDLQNPMRTRRAWEVLVSTGISMADWQDNTPPPLLNLKSCTAVCLDSDTEWLNERIERRFDMMVEMGALQECQGVLDRAEWDERMPSCKAIGAKELIAHLNGEMSLDDAITEAKTQTRRYAKRQRTWFRSKMNEWHRLRIDTLQSDADL